jgi:flagellar hook-length control protein FliK
MQSGLLQLLMPTLSSGVFGTTGQPAAEGSGTAFAQLFALLQGQLGDGMATDPAQALMAAKAALLAQANAGSDESGVAVETEALKTLEGLPPEALALLATLVPAGAPELSLEASALKSIVSDATPDDTAAALQWLKSLAGQEPDVPGVPGLAVTAGATAAVASAPGMAEVTPAPQSAKVTQAAPVAAVPVTVPVEATVVAQVAPEPAGPTQVAIQETVAAGLDGSKLPQAAVTTAEVVDLKVQKAAVRPQPVRSVPAVAVPPLHSDAVRPVAGPVPVVVEEAVVIAPLRQSGANGPATQFPLLRAADLLQSPVEPLAQASVVAAPDFGSALDQQAALGAQVKAVTTEAVVQPGTQPGLSSGLTLPELQAQAAKVVHSMVQDGEQRLTLRLIPEHLGEVRIEVRSEGGQVSVRILSANAAVRDALETHLHGLREAFVREGLTVQRVDVASNAPSLHTTGGSGHAGREAAYQPGNRGHNTPHPGAPQQYPNSSDFTPRRAAAAHRGTLNVFV